LRQLRRDAFISAAQVAYHYSYTLADALSLSSSERYLLTAVAASEEDKRWTRLGQLLGTNWDLEELAGHKKENEATDSLFLPLLPFLAPDLFNSVMSEAKEKAAKRKSVPEGTVEIGTLSKEQAKALFKSLSVKPKD
jgi:hypothetical protein